LKLASSIITENQPNTEASNNTKDIIKKTHTRKTPLNKNTRLVKNKKAAKLVTIGQILGYTT